MRAQVIATLGGDDGTRRRERLCWAAALALGFLQAWGRRHVSADGLLYIGADSIAYLDQADAWWRADWAAAVNAMWSPLYPWLLGLVLRLFQPGPYQELTAARLLNFVVYAGALASFAFCLRALLRIRGSHIIFGPQENEATDAQDAAHAAPNDARVYGWLSPPVLVLVGYAVFVWTALQMNRVSRISPDVLVAAFVYLAAGLLLRMRAHRGGLAPWRTFALLGLTLGVGYLAKTVMFPLAFVFLACAFCAAGRTRGALLRVLLALAVFLCVAAPLVLALSRKQGRLTVGDSARLNYAWYVNGVQPYTHWQGGPAANGTPLHPTRRLSDAPAAYEFASPVAGTYPPWYDPTYWYEGVRARFEPRAQLRAVARNLIFLARFGRARPFLPALFVALALLHYFGGRKRRLARDVATYYVLLVPALVACALYLLVNVEPRYLAPFVALLALALSAAVSSPRTKWRQRAQTLTIYALLLACALALAPAAARDALATLRDARDGSARADAQWQLADELRRAGGAPGARVAVVGDAMYAAWPRLARVRVVAEVPAQPAGNVASFWTMDAPRRQQLLAAFAQAGAQFVVADSAPPAAASEGWQRLRQTDAYVYFLGP
ncbi:MAG TPA: hypothetical protein VF546_08750 [Pyrinomonadaceae bacterium]|jgi:hypothetical protein